MAASVAHAGEPRFEDYPVTVAQPAKAHAPLLESKPMRTAPFSAEFHPPFKQYKIRLGYAIDGETTKAFAGHYRITEWGCGTGCQQSAIVDNISGNVYGYFSTHASLEFRPDSRLLIVNPGLDKAVAEGYLSDQHTSYWLWNGYGFTKLAK